MMKTNGERERCKPDPVVLKVEEVARKLKVAEQHVIDLIDEGQIGAINVGGGTRKFWRIPVAEFERFLARRNTLTHP